MRALIKVILFLCLIGLALAGGTLLGQLIQNDPGYVLLSYGTTTIEMSLWVGLVLAVAILALTYFTFRLIGRVLDSPVGLGRVWARLRGRSARGATQKGFMELRMGRYEAALKHLTTAAPRSDLAFINYLSAAEAANALGNDTQRDALLVKALETVPGSELAIGLAEARMQFDKQEFQACADTLSALRRIKPKDKELITMSCQVAEQIGDTDGLIALLPLARKLKALPEEPLQALELEAHRRALTQAVSDAESVDKPSAFPLSLRNTWDALPKSLRANASLVAILAQGLMQVGAHQAAQTELERALKAQLDSELLDLYGALSEVDLSTRQAFLAKLAKRHPEQASLAHARGRLALSADDLDQAEAAFEASLASDPAPATYEALACVYRAQGRTDMELKALQGLTESVRDWPSLNTSLPATQEDTVTDAEQSRV